MTLPSSVLNDFYAGFFFQDSVSGNLMRVENIKDDKVVISVGKEITPTGMAEITKKRFVYNISPGDLILGCDTLNRPRCYHLGEVTEIDENGIHVELTTTDQRKITHVFPIDDGMTPFMERIIPLMREPSQVLRNFPSTELQVSSKGGSPASVRGYRLDSPLLD